MKRRIPWLTLLLLLVVFTGIQCAKHALPPKAVSLPMIEGATTVGSAACADCHEETCKPFKKPSTAGSPLLRQRALARVVRHAMAEGACTLNQKTPLISYALASLPLPDNQGSVWTAIRCSTGWAVSTTSIT